MGSTSLSQTSDIGVDQEGIDEYLAEIEHLHHDDSQQIPSTGILKRIKTTSSLFTSTTLQETQCAV